MFNEICIYEAKTDKQKEIEILMKEVAEFYMQQPGIIDVRYIKRTHRQKDFNAVKEGEIPIRITRNIGKVTYMLHMVLENEEAHANLCKVALIKLADKINRETALIRAVLKPPVPADGDAVVSSPTEIVA